METLELELAEREKKSLLLYVVWQSCRAHCFHLFYFSWQGRGELSFFFLFYFSSGRKKGGHICWQCCGSALIRVRGLCVRRHFVADRRET